MSNKSERDKQKQIQDKCQAILGQLLREEDNKYCVDCDAKGPRWASWNLGIFLCIRCAGIHRNLGVHISRVKSVNLDSWTPEQVACLQQMGNSKARAVYEANLPDNFRRPQTDSSLEGFIRAKYEQKKYIAKEWVPPPMPKPANFSSSSVGKEFDIEDEKKKEKERKRPRAKGSSAEIPTLQQPTALPRPHSGGATSTATSTSASPSASQTKTASQAQSNTADLLGLDLGSSGDQLANAAGDPLGNFMSSISSPSVPSSAGSAAAVGATGQPVASPSAEENEFFNQTAPAEGQKKNVLTKESILSLYSTNTCPPPQQQMFVPGGMYIPQQQMYAPNHPVQAVRQMAQPSVSHGISNGAIMGPPQQNMSHVNNCPPMPMMGMPPVSNPFLNVALNSPVAHVPYRGITNGAIDINSVPVAAPNQMAQASIYPQQNDLIMFNPALTNLTYDSGTNPQLLHQFTQLQQQMAGLQLGGQPWMSSPVVPAAAPVAPVPGSQTVNWSGTMQGQTLSTNLWQ